jgi:hypothetical protein
LASPGRPRGPRHAKSAMLRIPKTPRGPISDFGRVGKFGDVKFFSYTDPLADLVKNNLVLWEGRLTRVTPDLPATRGLNTGSRGRGGGPSGRAQCVDGSGCVRFCVGTTVGELEGVPWTHDFV